MTCLEGLVNVMCLWWGKGCFLLGHKILWMLYLTLLHFTFLTASLHFSSVNNFWKQRVAQLFFLFFILSLLLSYSRGALVQKAIGISVLVGRALAPPRTFLSSHSWEWPLHTTCWTVHLVCLMPLTLSAFWLETREFQPGVTVLAPHSFALKYQPVPSLSQQGLKKWVIKNVGNLHE